MKIWWPHAEMLYTFLRLYSLTRDEELLAIYRQVEEYIFRVFPDAKHGEWIQIRNREGVPEEKLVALPVQGPFPYFTRLFENYSNPVPVGEVCRRIITLLSLFACWEGPPRKILPPQCP
jgi:mannose/cellobiose epimerase-like protein (N-acyl-D-glucosamine 2-epimerase family)